MPPKIAILLATHNRAHFLGETLDTIIAQTYTNWECIIVDDHSDDYTEEIVSFYLEKDERFSYCKKDPESKKGLSGTRNYGLKLVLERNVDFIQFFDDDDLMHPKKLELQISSLIGNPQSQLSICGWSNFTTYDQIHFDQKWEIRPSEKYTLGESYLIGDVKFVAQVPLFRYDYAKKFIFDQDLFYAEEWALLSQQFLLNNPDFEVVKDVLFYRRKHESSITERDDENFVVRKTQAIVKIKVFDFLTENKIHTRATLSYFTPHFLIYSYDPQKVKIIQKIVRSDKTYNLLDQYRIDLSIFIHYVLRKILLKVMNL